HATVFAVGLKSPDTDARALQSLATATDGRYAPAGTADLSGVYTGLASELSHQFVVSYQSTRTAGGQVSVAVGAAGAADSALALEPKIAPPPSPHTAAGPAQPFLASYTGLLVVLGLSFVAAFLLLTMVFGARSRSRRDRELVRRVATSPQPADQV